ncbi:MAG TPA: FAD-dependent oxidoreductase, partial [Firmicutes bacterium]|nr:FAD-dependent oxidoreductase [Bacillota bacterium]
RLNTRVGVDITLEDLNRQGYKAVFIAVGAHVGQELGIPGEDLDGVVSATDFLRQVNLGQLREVGRRVAVVGGGNAAIDAARTALRMGAKEVHILYRRTREEMPAEPGEVQEAEKEGVKIHYLTAPSSIIGKDGRVSKMECVRMVLGDFDRTGRRRPVPVAGSEFTVDVDMVIPAIGQKSDLSFMPEGSEAAVTRWATLVADPKTFEVAGMRGVFAGGDCVTGPDTVVSAIGQGRKAAIQIDKFLGGDGVLPVHPDLGRELAGDIIEKETPRVATNHLPIERRCPGFAEVDLGFTEDQALAEASRCLRCDIKEG